MSSHLVSSYRAEIPNAASIREATLEWQLAGDYEELAHYPPRTQAAKGGVQLQVVEEISRRDARAMARAGQGDRRRTDDPGQPPAFDRQKDAPRKEKTDTWFTARMTGVFYLPQSRALTLKFLQPPARTMGLRLPVHRPAAGARRPAERADPQEHQVASNWPRASITWRSWPATTSGRASSSSATRRTTGRSSPCRKAGFPRRSCPQIAAFLKPKATLKIEGDALVATLLDQPQRLRKMRLVFNDFVGTGVTVKSVTLKDEQGKVIVPVAEDFSSGKKSQVLQIAPGDRIQVSYEDARAIGGPKSLATDLNAAFYNGSIMLAYEEIMDRPGGGRLRIVPSRAAVPRRGSAHGDRRRSRCGHFRRSRHRRREVATSSGEKLSLKALETDPSGDSALDNHAGVFMATLKIGDRTRQDQIKVMPGDEITVSYLDKENTDPGVPIERTYSVMEAGGGAAKCLVYRTSVKQVEDTSNQAMARKSRIKARLGWAPPILTDQVVARHPQYQPQGARRGRRRARRSEETVVVALERAAVVRSDLPEECLELGKRDVRDGRGGVGDEGRGPGGQEAGVAQGAAPDRPHRRPGGGEGVSHPVAERLAPRRKANAPGRDVLRHRAIPVGQARRPGQRPRVLRRRGPGDRPAAGDGRQRTCQPGADAAGGRGRRGAPEVRGPANQADHRLEGATCSPTAAWN